MARAVIPRDRPKKRMRVKEAARHLECSRSWVYVLINRGELEAIRIGSRRGIQITRQSIEAYIASKNITGEQEES